MVNVISCSFSNKQWMATVEAHEFYIDGKGGQIGDTGTLGEVNVINVPNETTLILNKEIKPGEYNFSIDTERVYDIGVQHTAQHLFSAIAYNDYNLNTVGFRMTETYTTVDLDSSDIDENFTLELEKKINIAISEAHKVTATILTREKANKIDTFRKKISDKVIGDVRVVEIENLDTGACAGYHVDNTKDLKIFKILSFEKIKGNYTRFFFLAGDRAIEDYIFKNKIIKELGHKFSCRDYEILEMVEKQNIEKKSLETLVKDTTIKYCDLLKKDLIEKYTLINGIKYILVKEDIDIINQLSKIIDTENYTFIGIWDMGGIITSSSIHCGELVKKISETSNIKGGGKKERSNFKGEITLEEIIKLL